jgi:hypothetical protein
MPTLKAIHICNSHKLTQHQKLQKSMSFPTLTDRKNKKYDRTTLCISNSGFSAIMKHKSINQRSVLSDSLVA